VIAIDDFTRLWAHQLLIDPVLADQPAWGAVRCNATVVDLAGSEPAIRHRQNAAAAGGPVGQLRPDHPIAASETARRNARRPIPFFMAAKSRSSITMWP
jgi:hypothetical protein